MGKHDYTNYFLTGKNVVMIALQANALWTGFRRDVQKRAKGSDVSMRRKPSLHRYEVEICWSGSGDDFDILAVHIFHEHLTK